MNLIDLIRNSLAPSSSATDRANELEKRLATLRADQVEAVAAAAAEETTAGVEVAAALLERRSVPKAAAARIVEAQAVVSGYERAVTATESALAAAREGARQERIAELVEHLRTALREDAEVYSVAWASIAYGAAILRRLGAIAPGIGVHPLAEKFAVIGNGGRYVEPRAVALARALEMEGGSLALVPEDERRDLPFPVKELPTAAIERALSKLLPGGLDALRPEVVQAAAAKDVQDNAQRREHEAVAAAALARQPEATSWTDGERPR